MGLIATPIFLSLCAASVAQSEIPAGLAQYDGNYEIGTGHVVAITEFELDSSAPWVLAFTDLQTGRFGLLTRVGDDEYTLATGAMAGDPATTIRFVRSGEAVTGLTITDSGTGADAAPRSGVRRGGRREEVTIEAAGARLGATLHLPAGDERFPAVVIVPAGAVARTGAGPFPNFFLAEGFAVLAYDGRGSGDPGGFEGRAAEAIAAVELLRKRTDIDPGRVGLWGHSQGGWMSLVAASKSDAIAFVIDHAGMLVPAWRQELYRLAAEGEADGVPPAEIAAAVAFEGRLMEVARTGEGWDEIAAAMKANENEAWMGRVYRPASLAELKAVWRDDYSFDPTPFAARVKQPVLALFGGLDRSTPIESAANLAHAMKGNERLRIEFFPTANHAFLEAVNGGNREMDSLGRFVPGMFESMRAWLRAVVRRR